MVKHFVAITDKGREFLYRKSSMIAVPTKSAMKIVELLNKANFELREGEVWHLYENDWVSNDYISREIKALRKGRVKIKCNYGRLI